MACFIFFAALLAPARVLTDAVESDQLRFVGVTGTLWRGAALNVQVPGFRLNRTTWAVHPLELFVGRLAATVDTQWPGGFARGDLALQLNGTVRMREIEAAGPIAPIAQRMKLPAAGGSLVIAVSRLDIADGWPRSAVGEIRVGDVPLNLIGIAPGTNGSYKVSFDADEIPEDGGFSGSLEDLGGPIAITGSVALSPPGNYEFLAGIQARPDAPAELAQALNMLGPPDASGKHELRMSGSL